MNRTFRFLTQVLFWLVIWVVLWIMEGFDQKFLMGNGPIFIFQILLLAFLLYLAIPEVLFKKRIFIFLVGVVILVVGMALLSNMFGPEPPRELRRPMPGAGPHRGTPSRFFIHFLLMSIASAMAILIETFIYAKQKEDEHMRSRSENLQTELKLLKSQINPHFLFNALNNIYALSATNTVKTQNSIASLSEMLRYVLYECDRPLVSIKKEVAYIKNYLELFGLKSSKPFTIRADYELDNENLEIAPMLLIPFIENALKHGNLEQRGNAFLNINLRSKGDKVIFLVENSKSAKTTIKDKVGGIGLENVKKRLHILYSDRHSLIVKNEAEIFRVQLELKVNE